MNGIAIPSPLNRVGPFMPPRALSQFLSDRAEQRMEHEYRAMRESGLAFFEKYGIQPIRGAATAAAYDVTTATVFAMTTGAKTALNSISPAGHGLSLVEIGISFDGVTASAVPATCEIAQSTQATAGTSGVTPTITQVRGRVTSGSAPTGGSNYTAEPTTLTRLKIFYVPQYNGTYTYQLPLGREVECDSSGGTVKALALRINVSANVNFVGWMEVEALG